MELFAFFVLLFIAIFVRFEKKETKSSFKFGQSDSFSAHSWLTSRKPLTEIEQVAYWRIVRAVGENGIVLSQVAFSSFLVANGDYRSRFALFGRVKQNVADFVVCNKDFSIRYIVEIDDKSHDRNKDVERDRYNELAGIKTLRFKARNLPTTEELKEKLR